MPERIQRRRSAGWRMPEGAVYVGRPTRWANPFRVVPDGRFHGEQLYRVDLPNGLSVGRFVGGEHGRPLAHKLAVDLFTMHAAPTLGVAELTGRDLACWCPLELPCHADVLLELANTTEPPC